MQTAAGGPAFWEEAGESPSFQKDAQGMLYSASPVMATSRCTSDCIRVSSCNQNVSEDPACSCGWAEHARCNQKGHAQPDWLAILLTPTDTITCNGQVLSRLDCLVKLQHCDADGMSCRRYCEALKAGQRAIENPADLVKPASQACCCIDCTNGHAGNSPMRWT